MQSVAMKSAMFGTAVSVKTPSRAVARQQVRENPLR